MARTWIIPAGAGVLSALLFLSIALGSVGSIILSYLAPLPLFAMGLGAGLISAATAGATASALVGLIAGLIPAATFVALLVAPAVIVVRQALLSRIDAEGRLEWYPPGRLVMWLIGVGMTLFLAVMFFMSGGRSIEERLHSVFSSALSAYMGPQQAAVYQPVVDLLSGYPAFMVVPWMMILALNGMLAQGLLVRFQHNLRPSPPVAGIELPRTAGIVTAVVALVTATAGGWLEFVGRNLLLLLALAFFFAGLGVVHHFARGAHRLMILAAFYASMVPFFLILVAFVTLLGFVDHWAHLRQRFGGSPAGSV